MKRVVLIFLLFAQYVFAQESPVFPKGRDVFRALDRSDTKLVLIGDTDHDEDSIPISVARTLKEVKAVDEAYNCFFVEMDQRLQPALDEFWRLPGDSVMDYRKPMAELIQTKAQDLLFLLFQRQTADQIMARAKSLGMKIFAVDIDRSSPAGKAALHAAGLPDNSMRGDGTQVIDPKIFAKKTLEMRNRVMAKGINRHFLDGTCAKGIAFVGESHVLVSEVAGYKISSLYEELSAMNLKSIVASTFQLDCRTNDMDKTSCMELNRFLEQDVLFSPIPQQYRDRASGDFRIISSKSMKLTEP